MNNMKFTKGLIVGGLITAGLLMMCSDDCSVNTKKMTKKGKRTHKSLTKVTKNVIKFM